MGELRDSRPREGEPERRSWSSPIFATGRVRILLQSDRLMDMRTRRGQRVLRNKKGRSVEGPEPRCLVAWLPRCRRLVSPFPPPFLSLVSIIPPLLLSSFLSTHLLAPTSDLATLRSPQPARFISPSSPESFFSPPTLIHRYLRVYTPS